jgi:DNA-binding NarL/FixJ family response regulator
MADVRARRQVRVRQGQDHARHDPQRPSSQAAVMVIGSGSTRAVDFRLVKDYPLDPGRGDCHLARPLPFRGKSLRTTQVVLLSAFESSALEQQAEDAGCFAYLVKGGPPSTLRLTLHQAVASRRALLAPPGSSAVDR